MKLKFLNQLIINSKDRRTGENLNNCNFDNLLNISRCDCFAVKEVIFINNIYPINQYNNQLTVIVGSLNLTGTITLTPGNYNSTQLITEVVNQLNTLGLTTFSGSFNNITNKVTFTSTPLTINSMSGNLASVLGCTVFPFIPSVTYTGNNPINIYQTPYIRFTSNELLKYNKPNLTTDLKLNHLYILNNNQYSFGTSIHEKEQVPTQQLINWQRDNNINNFDIKLYDAYSNLADLNNSDWQIVLNFYQYKN